MFLRGHCQRQLRMTTTIIITLVILKICLPRNKYYSMKRKECLMQRMDQRDRREVVQVKKNNILNNNIIKFYRSYYRTQYLVSQSIFIAFIFNTRNIFYRYIQSLLHHLISLINSHKVTCIVVNVQPIFLILLQNHTRLK